MHILFDTSSVRLDQFVQKGDGISYFEGIPPYQRGRGYYVGVPRQRGAGVANVFRGLWRLFLPALKSAGKTIGKEGLATGSRILSNLAEGGNLNETLKNESTAGVQKLLSKVGNQEGKGIKRKRSRSKIHSNHQLVISPKNIIGRSVKISGKTSKKKKRTDAFGLY